MFCHYFAYGSNLSVERLESRVGSVVVRSAARVEDHAHRFSKLGRDGTGKGNIEPAPGEVVYGASYGLAEEQLDRLRAFEPGYRLMQVGAIVLATGDRLRAVTFCAISPRRGLRPSTSYVDHYRRGFADHGIPGDYIETVLAYTAP